jgi:hypothetical protein
MKNLVFIIPVLNDVRVWLLAAITYHCIKTAVIVEIHTHLLSEWRNAEVFATS